MAKINQDMIDQFRMMAAYRLARLDMTCADITLGRDAWTVASTSGILNYCYGNSALDIPAIDGCNDAHIQTALRAIFPNAVFKDKLHY